MNLFLHDPDKTDAIVIKVADLKFKPTYFCAAQVPFLWHAIDAKYGAIFSSIMN